jgi:hypothetical protein
VILKRKITGSNVKETDVKSGYFVFGSVIICLCVSYLTMLSSFRRYSTKALCYKPEGRRFNFQ